MSVEQERGMAGLLPSWVVKMLRKQIILGVEQAEARFKNLQGDEDFVTGALGQALMMTVEGVTKVPHTGGRESPRLFTWKTTFTPLGGRGTDSPEHRLGPDAVFELEVWNADGVSGGRKLVPIQAKKGWDGAERLLELQTSQMNQIPGGGIVVDYRAEGYRAVHSTVAFGAQGNARKIAPQHFRPLATYLAYDFLDCSVGSRDVYYDAIRKVFVIAGSDGLRVVRSFPRFRVRTSVRED